MRAVWIPARAQFLRRRGATATLTALVGLAGGVVLAAVAGASRTDTSMDRFMAFNRTEDVFVVVNGPQRGTADQVLAARARVVALPQVAEVARSPYLLLSPDKAGAEIGSVNPFAAADGHAFRTIDRPRVLQGRLARLDDPSEVVIDDTTAGLRHLRVGSKMPMYAFSAEQMNSAAAGGFERIPAPDGAVYSLRVVGIVREPSTVNPPPPSIVDNAVFAGQGGMILTPAFLRRYTADLKVSEEALPGMEGFRIRLRHGAADIPAFRKALADALSPGDGELHVGSDSQSAASKAHRAIHLEAISLILFGAVAGVASVIVVGQVLARQVAADAAENPTLAALGLDRRQLLLVAFARPVVIALAGAAVAVATAVAFSPIFPLGLARRAEIHPGVSVNVAVLAVGFVAVVVVVLLRALLQAWAEARTGSVRHADQAHARPARFTDAMANSGLGPAATVGAAMSFERGRGIAFRATVVGVAVAVAGVVAAVTFGVSLHHLVDTPSQQGWSWDVFVGNPNSQGDPGDPDSIRRKLASKLAANPNVGGYSGFALVESITLDGRQVNIAGVDAVKGSVFPPIIEGRPPSAPDEIVLGRDPLRQLHRRVGQTVIARSGDNSATMRIVGVWMQPTASDLSDKLSGGGGATLAGVRALVPAAPVYQFAVRYRTGVDRQAAFRSIRNDIGREVLRPYPAGDVSNLAQVDFLPYVLAAFLVTLALGALGLSLLTSVRRHRRDLAVLKAIGFAPHQVAATVAWQAAILVVVALVVGMPAGVALGRWTWHLVADNIGSVSPPVVPIAVLLVVPATLLIASLLAAGMGWAASRVRPATTLRTE